MPYKRPYGLARHNFVYFYLIFEMLRLVLKMLHYSPGTFFKTNITSVVVKVNKFVPIITHSGQSFS